MHADQKLSLEDLKKLDGYMQSSKYINKHLLNESENVLLSRLNDYKYVPKRIIWSQSPKRTQKVPANTILLDPSFKNKEMDRISRV